jgi:hypothetical protein
VARRIRISCCYEWRANANGIALAQDCGLKALGGRAAFLAAAVKGDTPLGFGLRSDGWVLYDSGEDGDGC